MEVLAQHRDLEAVRELLAYARIVIPRRSMRRSSLPTWSIGSSSTRQERSSYSVVQTRTRHSAHAKASIKLIWWPKREPPGVDGVDVPGTRRGPHRRVKPVTVTLARRLATPD